MDLIHAHRVDEIKEVAKWPTELDTLVLDVSGHESSDENEETTV